MRRAPTTTTAATVATERTSRLARYAQGTASASGGGSNTGLILGLVALVVVLGAGGVWVGRRRPAGDEDD